MGAYGFLPVLHGFDEDDDVGDVCVFFRVHGVKVERVCVFKESGEWFIDSE